MCSPSGLGQYLCCNILYVLQLTNAFLGKTRQESITVVKPACNKSMDESLCISLREKCSQLGNVPQVVKIYFVHIPNV